MHVPVVVIHVVAGVLKGGGVGDQVLHKGGVAVDCVLVVVQVAGTLLVGGVIVVQAPL